MWLLMAVALAGEPKSEAPSEIGEPTMIGHFETASFTVLSLAIGDVKGARRQAKDLMNHPGVPRAVVASADKIRDCKKLDCASQAVMAMGRTCANCHVNGGVGPQPQGMEQMPLLPPSRQHAIAAMYMWIGLVTPNEEAFEVGLGGAIPPIDLDSEDELYELMSQFEGYVAHAQEVQDWDERAAAFGQMLTTCAACHKAAGVDKRIKEQ